jgi:hypothetical protein
MSAEAEAAVAAPVAACLPLRTSLLAAPEVKAATCALAKHHHTRAMGDSLTRHTLVPAQQEQQANSTGGHMTGC